MSKRFSVRFTCSSVVPIEIISRLKIWEGSPSYQIEAKKADQNTQQIYLVFPAVLAKEHKHLLALHVSLVPAQCAKNVHFLEGEFFVDKVIEATFLSEIQPQAIVT